MTPLGEEVDRLRAELAASKLAFVELGRKLDAMTDLLREVWGAWCWSDAEGAVRVWLGVREEDDKLADRVETALKEEG